MQPYHSGVRISLATPHLREICSECSCSTAQILTCLHLAAVESGAQHIVDWLIQQVILYC